LATNGVIARTGIDTVAARTITASTGISVSNGDGVSGNPTITNSGVTSAVAGTGISVSGATGAVTITNSGVTTVNGSTGAVTVAATNQTMNIGTTAVAINRASANLALTGISSVAMPGSTSGTVTLQPAAAAGTTTITLPATTGTVITTGDSATVTNTMLAGSIANNKLTNSTISGVALGSNLGTLTMNVSGTGLSGSTTYNGSGASTFTVTSNATSANTASAIVARDASGNFTAGTITAALSGNATTATTLQTARTINGTSFNGSANITVTAAAGTLTGATLASGVTASSLTSVGTLSSLSVIGDLTVDTDTLKVDSVNNRVGIGTASPSQALEVSGSIAVGTQASKAVITYATNTARTLTIPNVGGNRTFAFIDQAQTISAVQTFSANPVLSAATATLSFSNTTGNKTISTGGTTNLILSPGGKVGIGTTDPAEKLHVAGNIYIGNGNQFIRYRSATIWDYYLSATNDDFFFYDSQNTNFFEARYNGGGTGKYFRILNTLFVSNSGSVGIGTTDPSSLLHINANVGAASSPSTTLRLSNSSDGGHRILFANSVTGTLAAIDADITSAGAGTDDSILKFWTATNGSMTEKVRITAAGRLVVNATDAVLDATLSAVALSGNSASAFKSGASTTFPVVSIWGDEASGNQIFTRFATDSNTERGSISYNRGGGLVAYNTTSDYRSKDIYGPLENTGAVIDALQVYSGKMKGATIERPMLVAHEAQAVAPYCVTGEKDAVDADGTPLYQQMDHQSLVPLLIAETQAMRARIENLEARLDTLES
jgi:hypothetical protein